MKLVRLVFTGNKHIRSPINVALTKRFPGGGTLQLKIRGGLAR